MKAKWFGQTIDIGHSKGYCAVYKFLEAFANKRYDERKLTAYEIAKVLGLSPSHVTRLLKQMLAENKVDFVCVVRRGKPAREWFAL